MRLTGSTPAAGTVPTRPRLREAEGEVLVVFLGNDEHIVELELPELRDQVAGLRRIDGEDATTVRRSRRTSSDTMDRAPRGTSCG